MGKKLKINGVLAYLEIGRTTLHRLRKKEDFPPPALEVGRILRWDSDDIDAWVLFTKTKKNR